MRIGWLGRANIEGLSNCPSKKANAKAEVEGLGPKLVTQLAGKPKTSIRLAISEESSLCTPPKKVQPFPSRLMGVRFRALKYP
jgi:hypothetical protein